jgi:hypothetical protein
VEIQHVNVKLLLANPERVALESLVPIFHTWIQDQGCEELLLDVADYSHVHAGPGVVLIGHEANYSVDNTDNRLGVRYNRKAVVEGNNQDRLAQATRAALSACKRLEEDPRLNGSFRFNGQELDLFVNDRLLVPNSDACREALSSELQTFSNQLFGEGRFTLSYTDNSRRLFSVSVRSSNQHDTAALLNRVAVNSPV